jgi:ABC-type Zn uptake system ZnuABC Zn-binding protein ZnuA
MKIIRSLLRCLPGTLAFSVLLFQPPTTLAAKKLSVTATTTMVTDLVKDVGGDRVAVRV